MKDSTDSPSLLKEALVAITERLVDDLSKETPPTPLAPHGSQVRKQALSAHETLSAIGERLTNGTELLVAALEKEEGSNS